jgi:phosphoribosyl-AMP cyclohydrolase
MHASILDAIKFDERGLVPAIAQDHRSKHVLMMAWMNRAAVEATLHEKRAVYYSRSRQCLWRKGESSGNVQKLLDIRLDCDGDTLLLSVEQVGGVACHTGRADCFYRALNEQGWYDAEDVLVDPEKLYSKETAQE